MAAESKDISQQKENKLIFNPDIHHRHSIRLKDYDYSLEGWYFITICTQNRECLFGKILNRQMILNEYGQNVNQCWLEIPNHFPSVILHEYIIMPNHLHGIIQIKYDNNNATPVGAGSACPNNNDRINHDGQANPAPTISHPHIALGNIIGYFKYQTTRQIDLPTKLWQRNYHEHIIRNQNSYQRIADYIGINPACWQMDKFYCQ